MAGQLLQTLCYQATGSKHGHLEAFHDPHFGIGLSAWQAYSNGSGKIQRDEFLKMRHPSAVEPSLASPNLGPWDGDKPK